jgi:hypothetical protein
MVLIIAGLFAMLNPRDNPIYLHSVLLIVFLEVIRIIYLAIRYKKDGVWIIATGIMLLFLISFYDFLLDIDLFLPLNKITNAHPFGFTSLILAMSIYLARDFSRKSDKIIEQDRQAKELEIEKRLLEAADERKSKELEEARKLQLSMLPNCVNDIPGIDICFHMQAATEVGGDYYDYRIDKDGTLTIVLS